ncbi:MAG: acetyl-CoA carboxylase biotin carboxyl carrier protein [Brevinemataceae bacterium]
MKKLLGISLDTWLELKTLFESSDIQGLTFGHEKLTISLKRKSNTTLVPMPISYSSTPITEIKQPALSPAPPQKDNYDDTNKYTKIISPIMGTFYSSASPDAAAFVQINSQISEGSTVCIVEAMKIYNEIKSPVSGKIIAVLKQKGDTVNIDDELFVIEKS